MGVFWRTGNDAQQALQNKSLPSYRVVRASCNRVEGVWSEIEHGHIRQTRFPSGHCGLLLLCRNVCCPVVGEVASPL